MQETKFDIIIIGGGVFGLSCARHLAKRGKSVALVESRRCGEGASKAALGGLWPASPLKHNALQTLQRQCLWDYDTTLASIEQDAGVRIPFSRPGRLERIQNKEHLKLVKQEAYAANQDWPHFGHDKVMEVLSPAEAQAIEPEADFGEFGAVYCRATALINPPQLVDALKQAAINTGVSLHENRAVNGLMIEDDRITGINSEDGQFKASQVLVAAGAWTSLLHPALKRYAPITPLKGEALRLKLARPLVKHIIKHYAIYMIQQPDNQIILGATSELHAGFDELTTKAGKNELLEDGKTFVPALRDAEIVAHWAGLRPAPNFRKPIMGPVPGIENLWVCTGHGKIGLSLAPKVGELMAGWMIDGQPAFDLSSFLPQLR